MFSFKNKDKVLKFLFYGSLISTSLSGCRDFSNVKQLGDNWKVIDQASTIIGNDFYQSCLRASKHPASARLFGLNDYFVAVKEKKEKCDSKYLSASNSILDTYSVYNEYLRKLSTLADRSTGKITTEQKNDLQTAIDNLVGQLEATEVKVPKLISDNIGSGANIIAVIFDLIGNKIRKNAIMPTIICTDDEIRTYTDGLIEISNTVYINQLRIERGTFESHITNFTPVTDGKITIKDAHNLFEMENLLAVKVTNLDEREMVARNLAKVLDKTTNTHTSISEVFTKDLKLTEKSKKKEFCDKYETKAFKNTKVSQFDNLNISKNSSIDIKNILIKYENETKPFIEEIASSRIYKKDIK